MTSYLIYFHRFGGERKSKINPYHFLPFGYGPRNCVGARFASVEAKLAIIKVVKRFKIEPSGETEVRGCVYIVPISPLLFDYFA